jgi:hypothetical protein
VSHNSIGVNERLNVISPTAHAMAILIAWVNVPIGTLDRRTGSTFETPAHSNALRVETSLRRVFTAIVDRPTLTHDLALALCSIIDSQCDLILEPCGQHRLSEVLQESFMLTSHSKSLFTSGGSEFEWLVVPFGSDKKVCSKENLISRNWDWKMHFQTILAQR